MAPKPFVAAKVWRRPYTSIYNDNYRFGNSLYSGAVDEIERKYADSMARTTFRSDRPDLHFTSLGGTLATGAGRGASPGGSDPGARRAALEQELITSAAVADSHCRSHSATRNQTTTVTSFDTYSSGRALASLEAELEESRAARRRRRAPRPESAYFADETSVPASVSVGQVGAGGTDAQNNAFWMERCRELHTEIDRVNSQLIGCETTIRTEAAAVKNKLNMEVSDLMMAIDEQDRVNQELAKALQKQKRQVQDLQQSYEGTQRGYAEAMDILSQVQRKAGQLCHEVDAMRTNMDQAVFKTTSTRIIYS